MKKNILFASLGSAGIATLLGLIGIYTSTSGITQADALEGVGSVMRYYQMAGVFGLFSIASFFVGLAYPSTVVETYSSADGGLSGTRVVNR